MSGVFERLWNILGNVLIPDLDSFLPPPYRRDLDWALVQSCRPFPGPTLCLFDEHKRTFLTSRYQHQSSSKSAVESDSVAHRAADLTSRTESLLEIEVGTIDDLFLSDLPINPRKKYRRRHRSVVLPLFLYAEDRHHDPP